MRAAIAFAILGISSAIAAPAKIRRQEDSVVEVDEVEGETVTTGEVTPEDVEVATEDSDVTTEDSDVTVTTPETEGGDAIPRSLVPTTYTLYNVWNGALDYDVEHGVVYKHNRNPDRTTIATFDFPASYEGKRCKFVFGLDNAAILSGSRRFDVYTTTENPTASTHSWPHGNKRDIHYGRMVAIQGGTAIYEDGHPKIGQDFACPHNGKFSYELVGVYDQVDIEWNKATAGPVIVVY